MSSGNRLRDGQADGGKRFSLDDPDFESYLRALKRHGCNLLVTGEAGDDVFAAMTRRLLGTGSERRVRLLALSDVTADDADRMLPDGLGVEDPEVWLFEYGSTTRNVATEAPSPTSTPDRSDLVEFQDDICEAIEEITFGTEGLAPGQLRVGVVSLCPFVNDYETETVAEFARTVGSEVLRSRGMAHYCLPIADDEPLVDELQSAFDARIEVRNRNGHTPLHRWHVPGQDLTTPWVEI